MTNPKQQIHDWLMRQQIPNGLGARPGGAPGAFSATARIAPQAIGPASGVYAIRSASDD